MTQSEFNERAESAIANIRKIADEEGLGLQLLGLSAPGADDPCPDGVRAVAVASPNPSLFARFVAESIMQVANHSVESGGGTLIAAVSALLTILVRQTAEGLDHDIGAKELAERITFGVAALDFADDFLGDSDA